MSSRTGRRWTVGVALAALLLTLAPAGSALAAAPTGAAGTSAPGAAACVGEDPAAVIAAGGSLILGRSVEQVNGYSRIKVDEVWSGPDVAPEIWLITGIQQTRRFGRDANLSDVTLANASEYLIAFDDDFRTDRCSVRQASNAVLAERPTGERPPVAGATTGVTPHEAPVGGLTVISYGVVGGLVLTVGIVAVLEARRRRSRQG